MPQKLTYTTYKPPQEFVVNQTSTVANPMSLVWGMFSNISNYWTNQPPSFELNRFQELPFNAETAVAKAHLQKEYLPRFNFAERHIEQRSSSDSLIEPLHMLSLMERVIEKWNKNHQFEVITTPKAAHTLYCKLFNKVGPPRGLSSSSLPTKGHFTPLSNTSKTNYFFNIAIQTLFSNLELAAAIGFSADQLPEAKVAFLAYREAIASEKMVPLDLATTLQMLYPCFIEECHHDASEALVKLIEPANKNREPFCSLQRKTT